MLEGQRVTLRLFAQEDLEEWMKLNARIFDRGEFYPIAVRSPVENRKKFSETGWWEENEGRMVIADKQGRLVGDIGYFKPGPYSSGYEIGYAILKPEDRGRGYMTAALRVFSAYLFELKSIARLQVVTLCGNAASRRVAEKCGYKFEGKLRSFCFLRGGYHDCDVLSLMREECLSLAEALRRDD